MKLLSPAKINLMLRILGQREDGYHFLQTYFQLLNWGDEICFTVLEQDKINIEGNFGNISIQNNLIYKAATLLLPYRQSNNGINIKVKKNIPQGSGLGGGSSNAGGTLTALNKLWNCQLADSKLLNLALKLGADVPIFVYNQSAMATGIGEKIEPLSIKKYYFVLIFPPISISTADIFATDELKRNQAAINKNKISNPAFWNNACFPVVLKKFPEIAEIYQEASRFSTIYMTGTGSTLFACFNSLAESKQFIKCCPDYYITQVCRSYRAPLS